MNSTLIFARRMSLALLVIAVVEHGNLKIDSSGSRPNTSGLTRLGRDLLRRAADLSITKTKLARVAPGSYTR